jgi:hypothetical protein
MRKRTQLANERDAKGRFTSAEPCYIASRNGVEYLEIAYPEKLTLTDIAKADKILRWKKRKGLNGAFDQSFSLLPEGRIQALRYLEMARIHRAPDGSRPNARFDALLERWAGLSAIDRIGVSMDQLCLDSGVDPSDAIGTAVTWGVRHGVALAQVIAAALLPKVVQAVARRAQAKENGAADARIMGEATGWLPTSKGVTVNQQFNQLNAGEIVKDIDESIAAEGLALPAFEADTVDACVVHNVRSEHEEKQRRN